MYIHNIIYTSLTRTFHLSFNHQIARTAKCQQKPLKAMVAKGYVYIDTHVYVRNIFVAYINIYVMYIYIHKWPTVYLNGVPAPISWGVGIRENLRVTFCLLNNKKTALKLENLLSK